MSKQYASKRMKILEFMREYGHISSMEGLSKLHIVDTRKRISELRRIGYNITDNWVAGKNADGIIVRYKEYYLEEANG